MTKTQFFSSKRYSLFRALGVLIGLLLGVVCSEILLSILNEPRFHKVLPKVDQFRFIQLLDGTKIQSNLQSAKIQFQYDSNPRGYFEEGNIVVHTTNSMGFRGDEFDDKRTINEKKIIFLGDSFTFGEGVKDKDTFALRTVDKLNEKEQKDLRYVSYNFGVGGLNTKQSVTLLKKVAIESQPDMVILNYNLNDAEPPLFRVNHQDGVVERLGDGRRGPAAGPGKVDDLDDLPGRKVGKAETANPT